MGIESIGRTAFDAVYEANARIVYKTALRYTGNHHTAEEITQSVFLKLYLYMDHINLGAVRSWLVVTARNMSLNYMRKACKEVLLEELEDEEETHSQVSESPEDKFLSKLRERKYKDFTSSMFDELFRENERWYEAVTITYCLEKPQRETAEIMGLSMDAFHSMLHRAKKWIKRNYEDQYDHLNKA